MTLTVVKCKLYLLAKKRMMMKNKPVDADARIGYSRLSSEAPQEGGGVGLSAHEIAEELQCGFAAAGFTLPSFSLSQNSHPAGFSQPCGVRFSHARTPTVRYPRLLRTNTPLPAPHHQRARANSPVRLIHHHHRAVGISPAAPATRPRRWRGSPRAYSYSACRAAPCRCAPCSPAAG